MRKILFFAVVAGLTVVSCNKDIEVREADGNSFPQCFYASEGEAVAPGTKVSFDEADLSFAWEDGDKIVVNGATYRRSEPNKMFRYYSGGFTTGSSGSIVAVYPDFLYTGGTAASSAKYSLPYTYTWNTSTGNVDYVPQAGLADADQYIRFRNIVSLFRLNVKNASPDTVWMKSVTVSSDKTMSGDFSLSFDGSGTPSISFVSSGAVYPSIQLEMDSVVELAPGASYPVYLPVPAQSYGTFNIKMMAYSAAGEGYDDIVFYNSSATTQSGTSETVASLVCERAKMYALNVNASSFSPGVIGDGSSTSPYLVGGLKDLGYIQEMIRSGSSAAKHHFVSSYYKLTSDIVLEGPWSTCLSWMAVNGSTLGFSGVFDGDGHVIDATAATNTSSIFWDVKDAVIKNLILKGNFHFGGNTATMSPFCASALGKCVTVSVAFIGDVTGTSYTSFFALGAYRGNCTIVGSYAKAKMQDTTTDWNVGAYQIYGCASPSYSGKMGATPYGVVGDMRTTSSPDVTKTYHTVNGKIVAADASFDDQAKVDEMEAAVNDWNASLKNKLNAGTITRSDYDRQSTKWMLSVDANGFCLVETSL